jgi:hypothetical protein
MKTARFVSLFCALLAAVSLAAASIASADGSPVESAATEAAPAAPVKEVVISEPFSVVTASGEVLYEPWFFEAMEKETLAPSRSSSSAALVSPAAESPCVANFICTYYKAEYESPQGAIECAFAGNVVLTNPGRSAKNRCGNKTNYLRTSGSVIACMNPGGSRPVPGPFNEVYVLINYGAFC